MAAQQELVSKFTPHMSAQGVQRAGLKADVSAEQVLKLPEPGNLGRKMLARERKGTASVCARDKLWRRPGRTGAVQRIHWLIYFWTSCWQPGRVRSSSLPIEIRFIFMWTEIPRKLLKPHTANVWLCLGRTICLFFRGNKSNEMF